MCLSSTFAIVHLSFFFSGAYFQFLFSPPHIQYPYCINYTNSLLVMVGRIGTKPKKRKTLPKSTPPTKQHLMEYTRSVRISIIFRKNDMLSWYTNLQNACLDSPTSFSTIQFGCSNYILYSIELNGYFIFDCQCYISTTVSYNKRYYVMNFKVYS